MPRLTHQDLRNFLHQIDGRSYPAYKDLANRYEFPDFTLFVDHVQGDPFAGPSRLRVQVPQQRAGYAAELFSNRPRRIGLENYLCDAFAAAARQVAGRRGSGKSGLIEIDAPGQELLERTALNVTADYVEARFVVGLPAAGRRVLGRQAAEMLVDDLPVVVKSALLFENNRADTLRRYVEVSEDAAALRAQLAAHGLIAFVADGSLLARRSGVDDRALKEGAIAFQSPASLRVTLTAPNVGELTGMGIPRGVTLIVGGGFHGKSTLLNALERGVYNHKPGDGREYVVTEADAVKIRAEDGRRVVGVNISPFIGELPYGRTTTAFTTDNASGSTSQAANIIEALELGATTLLIDEDTSATNFMIRDRRMQTLIAPDKEPITPFIDRVRQLYDDLGVSTVLVVGGSGDYFDVADTIIALDAYIPHDVTTAAKQIASQQPSGRHGPTGDFGAVSARVPLAASIDPSKGRREVNVKTRGLRTVQFGEETIDLSAVAQLVDDSQTRALADALVYAREQYMDGQRSLAEVLRLVLRDIARDGLDVLNNRKPGFYAEFRRFELGAALNRLRTLHVRQR